MPGGYVGKDLRVDLASGKTQEEKLSDEILRQFFPSYKGCLKRVLQIDGNGRRHGPSIASAPKKVGAGVCHL
jgi:hypothetical protein